ncbi:siderophore-interacting protein [Hoyosella altamirensis]|uniref:NADPH-dependent ferric siderophore reductase n=1 Tax=Hoyosella altamirensis TaxID=616997 RepID=A0A839RTT4_9ACTN|nr:siderophore-interacting protein [Hoyosella altamirensis]MBB3039747.1 NADPH-dependent ferric siderophore reductase [Hoyosella altamirensis]
MARHDDFYLAEVVSAHRITPNMIRIRFGGPELANFETSGYPDERLGVYFPNPGRPAPQRPSIDNGAWTFDDPDDEPEGRSYTVRKYHHDRGELDIDFVVHEGGVASSWALAAEPGAIVGLSSADGWFKPPVTTRNYVLVADATGLPGAGRILEELPSGVTATVITEIIDPADVQTVSSSASIDYRWLPGSGMGHGPSHLEHAIRALPAPGSDTYYWVAAEAAATRSIRKYLRKELGLSAKDMCVIGYWRANKEDFLRRYEPVQASMLQRYGQLVDSGIEGQELIDAWDAELERAGF